MALLKNRFKIPLILRNKLESFLPNFINTHSHLIIEENETNFRITHSKNIDFFILADMELFRIEKPSIFVKSAPKSDMSLEFSARVVDLENLESDFNKWISLVEKYLSPSPLFDDPIEAAVQIPFNETTDFRNDELLQLKIALNELKSIAAKQLELTEHQSKLLNARMDDLISSSDRINKKDLKLLVIGTIASLLQDLALDPEKANKLVELFTKALQSIPHILLLH